MIKKLLRPFIPSFILNKRYRRGQKKLLEAWEKSGCPDPPPDIVKQITVAEYQNKYGYSTLLETGTFMGDMVEAQKKRFQKIISIELDIDLFKRAKKRFKNDRNVPIAQGDSGKVLPVILKNINEPAIFWLDGHYSGGITAKGDKECPIFEEIDAVFNSKTFNNILLIDDARCFNGQGDYPAIEKLTEYILSKNQKYQVEIKWDIIRFVI